MKAHVTGANRLRAAMFAFDRAACRAITRALLSVNWRNVAGLLAMTTFWVFALSIAFFGATR